MHQRAKFRVDCMNRCGDMTVFDFSKWRQSAILYFEKFEFLTARPVRRANMRHQAKFRADRSNCCRDMAVFQFFKMAASSILNLIHSAFPCFSRCRQNSALIAMLKTSAGSISFNSWLRC